jgi:hypothetical protein
VAVGEHVPCPEHVALCQLPLPVQVCVSVPQLPQATELVWPGAQTPVHVPLTHVWFVHRTGVPHSSLESQVWALLPEHSFCPDVQAPMHTPPTHMPVLHVVGGCHCPQAPQSSTLVAVAHWGTPGVQTGVIGHEQVPHPQAGVQVCVPYESHACVAPGTHAPCPEHVPLDIHASLAQVCVSVPQLPQGTGSV